MPTPVEPLVVKGHGGSSVSFDGEFVTLIRKGLSRLTVGKGDKRIHIGNITAVQFKPAGMINGFIQFTVPGGVERRSAFGSQTRGAVNDENSVIFTRKQQPEFEHLRDAIESAVAAQHRQQPVQAAPDGVAQLGKLAELRQAGVITDAEFEASKRKILNSL
jgi:membrane protease subunit (stomatin/prohibitin family)